MQKQYLLETSGSSVESPKVISADATPSLMYQSGDHDRSKRVTGDDNDATVNGLPDVSQLLRVKFNKFQNGFRKRRAMSLHVSISDKDKSQATFYVPTPTMPRSGPADDDDDDEVAPSAELDIAERTTTTTPSVPSHGSAEPNSLPATVSALSRIPCGRLNYRKSPSECSSGRGTVTPTEEFDNDSSGSNQSSKSLQIRFVDIFYSDGNYLLNSVTNSNRSCSFRKSSFFICPLLFSLFYKK